MKKLKWATGLQGMIQVRVFTDVICVRPMIEMCIPSVLDPTLAPKGNHVATIFTQYTPYTLNTGPWTEQDREAYANTG